MEWLLGEQSYGWWASWVLYAGIAYILLAKKVDPARYFPDHITRIGVVFIKLKWTFLFFITWLFGLVVIMFIVSLFK